MNVFRVQSKENTSNLHTGFNTVLAAVEPCESQSSITLLFPQNVRENKHTASVN